MFRLLDLTRLALERLVQHRTLALWVLVGLTMASTLAISIPLYVDAVNTGLLESHLDQPPYAFRYRYLGTWEGNIDVEDVTRTDAAIFERFLDTIGLSVTTQMQYVRGGTWAVRRDTQTLGTYGVGFLNGASDHLNIVAGDWPPSEPQASGTADDPIPALIPESMLYNMGLQVGDLLTVQMSGVPAQTLRVAALWRPVNEDDPTWVLAPRYFENMFLVQPDALWQMVGPIKKPVEEVAWWLVMDGRSVKTSDVTGLMDRIVIGQRDVRRALPSVREDASPYKKLAAFNHEANRLMRQLALSILPVGGLVLYFVSAVASLLVMRQQQEDVTLRSRGMSRWTILQIYLLMWAVLAGLAFGLGLLASPQVVRLVGQTSSFLRFSGVGDMLTVTFNQQAILIGVITVLISVLTGLVIAWRTTGQTILSLKRQSARAQQAWWQRIYLDVMLLVPGVYVWYSLSHKGGVVASTDDPFADPLTFAGPTLFSLGATLLLLRLGVFVLRVGMRSAALLPGLPLLMALRELTRSVSRYRGGLLMTTFTLSLTGFTASMASTIDHSLEDTIRYRVGAQAVIVTAAEAQTKQQAGSQSQQQTRKVVGFNAPPVEDLRRLQDIAALSPVGRYPARLALPGAPIEGTIVGINRATMAAISQWRNDYAAEPLADLLNRLAGNRTGVLISRQTADDYGLIVGQEIKVEVFALDKWYSMTAPIAGLVDYFPTLDPRQQFFLITNLDPIFEAVGSPLPYDVWLALQPGADPAAVQAAVRQMDFPMLEWRDPASELAAARAAPSRRGVLGFLSVGFIAAVVLTLIQTIIQSAAAFRSQTVQLGALRAMGLSGRAVASYLVLVQIIAAGIGIAGGTVIGVLASRAFLPLFDFSGGLPPYFVQVAWNDITLVYGIFGGVLLGVTLMTTFFLGRESLTALVKLGDV
jgi:putative ABC transport system permease protein